MHSSEGYAHTHFMQKMQIVQQLREEGFYIVNDWANDDDPASTIHFHNGGVTKAFADISRHIIDNFETTRTIAEKFGRTQKGAILVPVPTYGMFLDKLEDLTADKNIQIVPVRRKDDGSVDEMSLLIKMQECEESNHRILSYYDCNPHNPTGHIRDEAETHKIARILEDLTARQRADDKQFISTCRGLTDINTNLVQLISRYRDTTYANPIIIEDMAYEGTEICPNKKPYSFAQASSALAEHTVVLKGISKIGMPGMRIGLSIAPPEINDPLFSEQSMTEFSAHSIGVDVITARYGKHPKSHLFEQHKEKLAQAHKERFTFAKVFFRGINNVPELTHEQRHKIINNYASNTGRTVEEAEIRLNHGLPNFRIQDDLESGFFLMVNLEALRTKKVAIHFDNEMWPQEHKIKSSNILFWTLRGFQIKAIPASELGLSDNSLSARLTLSISESDFYRMFDQLSEMHDHFFGATPNVQFDMFIDHLSVDPDSGLNV